MRLRIRFPWFTLEAEPGARPRWRCALAMLGHELLHLIGVDPHRPGALGYRSTLRYAIGAPTTRGLPGLRGSFRVVGSDTDLDTLPVLDGVTLYVTDGIGQDVGGTGAVVEVRRGNASTGLWERIDGASGSAGVRAVSMIDADLELDDFAGVTLVLATNMVTDDRTLTLPLSTGSVQHVIVRRANSFEDVAVIVEVDDADIFETGVKEIRFRSGGGAGPDRTIEFMNDPELERWYPLTPFNPLESIVEGTGIDVDATDPGNPIVSISDAIQPGVPHVRAFNVNFDDEDLVAGRELFNPHAGDLILDVWYELLVAWDQSAKFDVGTFDGVPFGIFETDTGDACELDWPDTPVSPLSCVRGAAINHTRSTDAVAASVTHWIRDATDVGPGGGQVLRRNGMPGRFISTDPVKVCISTTGLTSGDEPGATAGQLIVYFLIVKQPTIE